MAAWWAHDAGRSERLQATTAAWPQGPAAWLDLLPVGVLLLGADGEVHAANAEASRLLVTGIDVGGAATRLVDTLPTRYRDVVEAAIATASSGEPSRCDVTIDGTGAGLELELIGTDLVGPDGGPTVVATVHDVSHRLEREGDLEHRATHDALTGLPNRAWMLDHIHRRLEEGAPLVLAFVDLDRFKEVNDRMGHETGDAVLSDVAVSLSRCLHPGEVAVRMGGDEFVVISSALDGDEIADFDLRIRLAVATVPSARELQVGVSVGVARSEPGDDPWSLLRRADSAMYRHKRRTDRRRGPADRRSERPAP
jgi:diguanylate cyclase (GGDEF)-like protein